MGKLTKRAVDAHTPPVRGQTFLWDGEIRGFGLRVVPSGLKTFIVQYRNVEGRTRRMAIGRYGVMTVEQARDQAKVKLGAVAGGSDPAAENASLREAITVTEVCDWYLAEAEAGRILGRRHRPIKTSTLAMDRSRIETHIKPLLGRRQVRALKLGDIEAMQSDIAGGRTAKPRGVGRGGATTGGAGVAARTVSTLQSLFAHAVRLDVITSNPAVGVRKRAGKKKERRLSVTEIKRLGEAMRFAERNDEHPVGLAGVRLMLLTGFRISEVQGMKRAWLHADQGYVHFPDTKSDGQVRAIGSRAADLAGSQPVRRHCPYVFPSDIGDGHFTATKSCLARLCAGANIEGVTPHTLRHTFGSVAGDLGFSELTIAALLGHAARGVTQGYVHIDEALKLAATRTCEEIASLLETGGEGSTVKG
ncbi:MULTISPECIES: tyrosine-type recombinase/integrase [unclassified Mesorhizobium]|uniref:tyrosine-type recombinase/integrase n=1 Tax=unclassified Mesorhizobium TaxID=325217 RepID=UPI0015E3B2EA|nr:MULTISPECIES: site-specific integrase [unclassified Mesorhizobium]MBZ9703238.1 site-specific integrase [Mesorhizobium sp. CO1-1-3]MBZ9947089.1 site-specific integrase [Mesorhizobium sp. BR1-1-11]